MINLKSLKVIYDFVKIKNLYKILMFARYIIMKKSLICVERERRILEFKFNACKDSKLRNTGIF